eukprot:TRINITY_DN2996_c0_g1_i1.p1 TRINITY_DN2996_c0_g1~~TRINITY_DN2996_c0_g1_i1.p1  ORF type:complete len:328 (+),score=44.19 TRINITY_DN2996_c0_g1_i1:141-1124(+)
MALVDMPGAALPFSRPHQMEPAMDRISAFATSLPKSKRGLGQQLGNPPDPATAPLRFRGTGRPWFLMPVNFRNQHQDTVSHCPSPWSAPRALVAGNMGLSSSSPTATSSRFLLDLEIPLRAGNVSDPDDRLHIFQSCTLACAALAVTVFLSSSSPAMADDTTPYMRSQSTLLEEWQQTGLVNGRIRSCPSDVNPNCVSTSSNNASYGLPWVVPTPQNGSSGPLLSNTVSKLESAIVSSQKNASIVQSTDAEGGYYIKAELDGLYGRDVLEFFVREDMVLYRSMAQRVLYVYPFTTPLGDFDAQRRHLREVQSELGWLSFSCEDLSCY